MLFQGGAVRVHRWQVRSGLGGGGATVVELESWDVEELAPALQDQTTYEHDAGLKVTFSPS